MDTLLNMIKGLMYRELGRIILLNWGGIKIRMDRKQKTGFYKLLPVNAYLNDIFKMVIIQST